MNHQHAKELFAEYHDGELSGSKLSELQAHLASCRECELEWQAYQKTMSGVSGLLNLPPPENLVRAVETKIHRRSKGKFFGRSKQAPIQFALISFILLLMFILAYLMLTAVNEIVVLDAQTGPEHPPAKSAKP